jgi:hypothetical protein
MVLDDRPEVAIQLDSHATLEIAGRDHVSLI